LPVLKKNTGLREPPGRSVPGGFECCKEERFFHCFQSLGGGANLWGLRRRWGFARLVPARLRD